MAVVAISFLTFSSPLFGQSLFESLPAAEHAEHEQEQERGPLTAEQKAAGMRESIF
jgi:hypothetical protein